jgi:drug/metabolite transporter superfamily protein YnfA
MVEEGRAGRNDKMSFADIGFLCMVFVAVILTLSSPEEFVRVFATFFVILESFALRYYIMEAQYGAKLQARVPRNR